MRFIVVRYLHSIRWKQQLKIISGQLGMLRNYQFEAINRVEGNERRINYSLSLQTRYYSGTISHDQSSYRVIVLYNVECQVQGLLQNSKQNNATFGYFLRMLQAKWQRY